MMQVDLEPVAGALLILALSLQYYFQRHESNQIAVWDKLYNAGML